MINMVLPESERKNSLKVKRGIPETLAEMYEGSSDLEKETKSYSLFVFETGKMDLVHRKKQKRFGGSYRFISQSPEEIKNELEEIAGQRDIILRFREPLPDIYGTVLKDGTLLDIREMLGDLEKKYS